VNPGLDAHPVLVFQKVQLKEIQFSPVYPQLFQGCLFRDEEGSGKPIRNPLAIQILRRFNHKVTQFMRHTESLPVSGNPIPDYDGRRRVMPECDGVK